MHPTAVSAEVFFVTAVNTGIYLVS